MVKRTTSSFGLVGTDWQQRINWSDVRNYRLNRAREAMKENNLGAMLDMYDENVRYTDERIRELLAEQSDVEMAFDVVAM